MSNVFQTNVANKPPKNSSSKVNLRVVLSTFQNFHDFPSTHLWEMICTNMNKRSTKVICLAISTDYSVCPVQVLTGRFSQKLMKCSFNRCFAIVDHDKFWSTIRFSEIFLLHLFQLHQWLPVRKRIMLRCYMFKNCNRWRSTKYKSCCQGI